jgi:F-box and leucine-rich repeat protein 14
VNLKHLDLSGCEELTDQALGSISCLGNLRTLNLHACSSLTAKGFRSALQPLTQLESINLTDTRVISRDSLPALTRLARSLRSLVLANCEVTNPILKQLAEMSELTRLDLSECHSASTCVTTTLFSFLTSS